MGREIKRVPVDFDWQLNEVWSGFLSPDKFQEKPCPDCKNGYSAHAQNLLDLWYGHLPFDPESTGSTPFTLHTPAVRALAERNVSRSPEFYGTEEEAIRRETYRLSTLFNSQWSHHISQDDVQALVDGGRLWDFTRKWGDGGWEDIDPPVVPTAAEVNEWSLRGMGHDSLNAGIVIRARCEREGFEVTCRTCQGHGSLEAYEGQRAEAEAWEQQEPPAGDGWQLWETVSEGSPISPVFATAEELAQWLTTDAAVRGAMRRPMTIEQARGFVGEGWAPSMIGNAGGLHDGATYIGTEAAVAGLFEDVDDA